MVSYAKDAEWFRWSTACIEKNLTGYRRVVVVAPIQDAKLFDSIARERRNVQMHYIPDWPRAGYHWQQWVKMNADTYSDADIILHVDSDVFIKEPVDVSGFLHDGNPGWLWAYYTDVTDAIVWKEPTERAFGGVVEREFMQGLPAPIRRETYAVAREWIRERHHMDCAEYIRACATRGNQSFSEFNFMGAVAYHAQRELYHWVDRNRDPWPPAYHKSRQFWSHAPIADHMLEIQQMLHGGSTSHIRTTNRGIWVLSNDTHISRWVEQQNRLDFDVPLLNRLCAYIRPGDVVVDVGAFIGDHTLAYARATHGVSTGRVLAFEPNPTAYECLKRNMAALEHVQCFRAGLSDSGGNACLCESPNAGASYLIPGTGIPLVTLDSFQLTRLNFIKIDAEGYEMRILRGAQETIRRCRPVMFIEINDGALRRAGEDPNQVMIWIAAQGYRIEGARHGEPQYDILCLPT